VVMGRRSSRRRHRSARRSSRAVPLPSAVLLSPALSPFGASETPTAGLTSGRGLAERPGLVRSSAAPAVTGSAAALDPPVRRVRRASRPAVVPPAFAEGGGSAARKGSRCRRLSPPPLRRRPPPCRSTSPRGSLMQRGGLGSRIAEPPLAGRSAPYAVRLAPCVVYPSGRRLSIEGRRRAFSASLPPRRAISGSSPIVRSTAPSYASLPGNIEPESAGYGTPLVC
jgi:hypothetical protein